MRGVPLRLRGGRAPQIGDRTFECRSSKPGDGKPELFTAIAWSPGPFPAAELWCYRTAEGAPWDQLNPGFTQDPSKFSELWLDSVPEEEGFTPPTGHGPESSVTHEALKAYAQQRLATAMGLAPVCCGGWEVYLHRPYPADFGSANPKIDTAGDNGSLYQVQQSDQVSGLSGPLAYLWVTKQGGREIWLLYDPGQEGGFRVVGDSEEEDYFERTKLVFERLHDLGDEWPEILVNTTAVDVTAGYAAAIGAYRAWALLQYECPAYEIQQLVVHDWRVMVE
jgi:hypothetical protein